MTLADRVRHLITARHASVNSAARVLGLPQRTLADVVSGKVKNPRADLVKRIAEFHGVTTDWLISGEGELPPLDPDLMHFPVEAAGKWDELIGGLGLSLEAEEIIGGAPYAFGDTIAQLPFVLERDDHEAVAKIRKARYFGYAAWIALVSSLIDLWGKDVVRERLNHPAIVAWFKQHYGREYLKANIWQAVEKEWQFSRQYAEAKKLSRKK